MQSAPSSPGSRTEICKNAWLLVEQHGSNAPVVAAKRLDQLMIGGDKHSALSWIAILRAVQELLTATPSAVIH